MKLKNSDAQYLYLMFQKRNKELDAKLLILQERITILAKENEKLREQVERAKNLGFVK